MSDYTVVIDADDTQYEVGVDFTVNKGCKATMTSPAEPSTLDIDYAPIEKALGREASESEIEDIEEQIWNYLAKSSEWSD